MSAQKLVLVLFGTLLFSARGRAEPEGAPETEVAPPAEANLESLEALLDEPVVTTATRAPERASTAPATVFSITAEDMRAFGVRSVDEALAYLGVGMHVQKARDYSTGLDVGAQGIMLRDYGRHLLVLLDGHVVNAQSSGHAPLHEALGVPLEAIDHIEVMLGAGSVMYGSNAMTAVVHITTKSAERDRGTHAVAELSVAPPSNRDGYARAPRGGHEAGYHYRLGAGTSHLGHWGKTPVSIALRAEWQHALSETYQVQPVMDDESQLRPGETAWGGLASHTMRAPSGTATVRIGDFRLQLQGSLYERTTPLVGLFNDQDASEKRRAVRLDLSHAALLSNTLRLSSRLYGDVTNSTDQNHWTAEVWCLPGQVDGCEFRARDASRWIGVEQQLGYQPRADGSLTGSLGYDLRFREAHGRPAEYRSLAAGSPPTEAPNSSYRDHSVLGAVFAQVLYAPWEWLTLNVGLRLDVDSWFGARLSPRAAAVVMPHRDTSIRASYAEAFRSPTPMELNQTDATYVIRANNLGPEVVRTAELEWQQRLDQFSFAIRGFASFYENLIGSRSATEDEVARAFQSGELVSTADPTWTITNDNVQRIRSYGASLTVQVRPAAGWTLAGSTTVSRSSTDDAVLTLWPRAFGNVRVAYEFKKDGPIVGLSAVYARRRRVFSDFDPETAQVLHPYARPQLDLRLTVSSPVRRLPGLSVRGGLGARVFPDLPYLLTTPTTSGPDSPVQYIHDQPQLHALLGLSYDF